MMEEGMECSKCLFCLDKIIPYSLSSLEHEEENEKIKLPNFHNLCKLLGILITDDTLKRLRSLPINTFIDNSDDNVPSNDEGNSEWASSTCDKSCETFLCLCCFELVEKLIKLYEELEKIKARIGNTTNKIRDVIIKTIGEDTKVVNDAAKRKRGRPPKTQNKTCSKDNPLLDLRQQVFQDFVRKPNSMTPTILERHPDHSNKSKCVKGNAAKGTDNATHGSPEEATTREDDGGGRKQLLLDEDTEIKIEVDDDEEDPIEDSECLQNEYEDTNDDLSNTTPKTVETRDMEIPEPSPLKEDAKTRSRRSKRIAGVRDSGNVTPPRKRKYKSKFKSDQRFTCHPCNITFNRQSDYSLHRKKDHAPLNANSLPITKVYEMKNGKRKEIWVCSICEHRERGGRLGPYMEHMLSHEITATASTDLHSCDKCDKQFTLKLNLDLHQICLHDWKHIHLKCEFCENTDCKTQEDFIAHLRSHMDDPSTAPIHACKSCPMAASTLDKLLEHMKKHSSSKRLLCPECPDEYSILKELHRHCHQVHPDLKQKFDCPHCTKSFLMRVSLETHLKLTHGIGDDTFGGAYTCSKCNTGKIFKSKMSLQMHLSRMHGDKPHKCPQCEKSFLFPSLLQMHVEDKHEKIRYQCPHCPKSYTERVQLGYHMRTHTGEGLYTCDRCGKQFPRPQELKIHSITHLEKSEQTRCVCEICGKEFGNELHLRKHKNSHKEKKLECQYCHLKFRRPDHLRGHLRTHTGERPYICPVCSKGFNRRDILIVHMKMHGFSQEEGAKVYDKHCEKLKQEAN